MVSLKGLASLFWLNLEKTKVSDAGLELLSAFAKLGSLNVTATKVTEAGVKKLAAALPNCKIEWEGSVLEPTRLSNPLGMERAPVLKGHVSATYKECSL